MADLPDKLQRRLEQLGELCALSPAELLGPAASRRATFRLRRGASESVLTELDSAGATPTPLLGLPGCHAVERQQRELLTHSPAAERGDIYVQGAASVRAARAVEARPGERVLDLAAAPGGKTLVLADALQQQGELVAVEPIAARFHRLRTNLATAGHGEFVQTLRSDGRRVPGDFEQRFDRVLLDAPCSSEARIDPADPATFERWSLGKIRDMARKQWGLLGRAIRCLRPGGEMIYCTCSFAPEENEAQLAAHLPGGRSGDDGSGPQIEMLQVDVGEGVRTVPGLTRWGRKKWPPECALAKRVVPDRDHEGLFIARLRRVQ